MDRRRQSCGCVLPVALFLSVGCVRSTEFESTTRTSGGSVTISAVEPIWNDPDVGVVHVMHDGSEMPGLPAGFLEWRGHPGPILDRRILDKLGQRIEVVPSMGAGAPYAQVRTPHNSTERTVENLQALLDDLRRSSNAFDSIIVGVGKSSDRQVEASEAVCEFARRENKSVVEIHSRSLGTPSHHAKIRVMRQSQATRPSFSSTD